MTRISDVMKEDHRAMRDDYMKIVEAPDDDTKTRWADQVKLQMLKDGRIRAC